MVIGVMVFGIEIVFFSGSVDYRKFCLVSWSLGGMVCGKIPIPRSDP